MSKAAKESDLQLLARYTRDRAEDAFAELVRRHVNLVYSAALRQVRSPQLAEEVAQSALADLARQADKLKPGTVVTAWLYQVTHHKFVDVIRKESRRQLREQIAVEMNAMNTDAATWNQIEPLLDEAMSALDDTDRAAVLLRYFENKSLREVGTTLGTSDDAAQKRVSRAVERLREFFAKRGVSVGAGGMVVVISANAVQAAPVGLAVTISTAAALTGTTLATTATVTATKAIAMTTLQKTLVTASVAILAGVGIYETRQASQLRDEVQTLQQQQALVSEQNERLRLQTESLGKQLAQAREDVSRFHTGTDQTDVLRLRSEVGMLRRATNDLAKAMQNYQTLAVQSLQLTSRDMFKLRRLQMSDAMSELLTALKQYTGEHEGDYPMNLDDLRNSTGFSGTNFAGSLGLSDFMVLNPPYDFNDKRLILRNRLPLENPDGTGEWVYGGLDTSGIPVTITMGAQFGN